MDEFLVQTHDISPETEGVLEFLIAVLWLLCLKRYERCSFRFGFSLSLGFWGKEASLFAIIGFVDEKVFFFFIAVSLFVENLQFALARAPFELCDI